MAQLDVLIPTFDRPAALAVTFTSLIGQTQRGFRVVISDQSDEPACANSRELQAALRVLRARGHVVEVHHHLPRRGLAEQRDFLLAQVRAHYALFLDDDLILDIGPKSAQALEAILRNAGTVVWNGPVGVFEHEQFAAGTRTLAHAIAESKAFSIAGGGDTVAAINKFGVTERISYISTAGGAFLEFLEGKKLPAIEVLEQRAAV